MGRTEDRNAVRSRESGLSLVEVVLALGLMGAVMISIAGLFVVSERQVASGKTASEALAVGRTMLEEINAWGFRQTYREFGFDGSAASYSIDTSSHADAAKWQAMLDDVLEHGSSATIDIEAVGPVGGTVPTLANARAMRLTITVTWSEGPRNRSIQVSTVRL